MTETSLVNHENKAKNSTPTHPALEGELYVVATPIGNLRDITLRALDILRGADVIYCEDTRTSRTLMLAYQITTPLQPYHEHNAAKQRPKIMQQLAAGQAIALISDAGTPAISDPGYKLVKDARDAGHPVTPLPGPCAAITALTVSGLPTDRFYFEGFLPNKAGLRHTALLQLQHRPETLIFYESPRRLLDSLQAMVEIFGPMREATVAREITKRFEEFRRGSLQELVAHYQQADTPKGEIVLLVQGHRGAELADDEVEALLRQAMESLSVKDAAAQLAELTGKPKRILYQLALSLKDG